MIRTLTIAALSAAVGYAVGQRAAENTESRFSRPEVTGDEVVVEDDEWPLSEEFVSPEEYDPLDPNNEDGVIGQ